MRKQRIPYLLEINVEFSFSINPHSFICTDAEELQGATVLIIRLDGIRISNTSSTTHGKSAISAQT